MPDTDSDVSVTDTQDQQSVASDVRAEKVVEEKKEDSSDEKAEPKPPPLDPSATPPPRGGDRELESDRKELAKVQQEAFDRFLKASVGQRADLLRDVLAVQVTILIGTAALFFVRGGDDFIKTKGLFFFSMAVIAVGSVINLLARIEIVNHLQAMSYQIEDRYLRLVRSVRDYLLTPTRTNLDTAYRIEYEFQNFPNLRRIGQEGHKYSIWLLIVGVLGIALSLMFKVGT
ncbi:MAG TPA: hypothetical protein VFW90_02550 [Candidatus Saccharimonadales bacterium]|nr:hypothetical protein [Candidatus Saccharimonadales bacterium]